MYDITYVIYLTDLNVIKKQVKPHYLFVNLDLKYVRMGPDVYAAVTPINSSMCKQIKRIIKLDFNNSAWKPDKIDTQLREHLVGIEQKVYVCLSSGRGLTG